MELTTLSQLYFFAALFGGAACGALVGWLTRFEIGLGVGLLIPGVVAAWSGLQCVDAWRAYSTGASLSAVVVAVRDVPTNADGSVTQEVPSVRYRDAAGVERTVNGPAASGWKQGQRVRVLADGVRPDLAQRVALPSNLRGGAIAMMLFATFLLSLGLWFCVGALGDAQPGSDAAPRPRRRGARALAPAAVRDTSGTARVAHRNKLFVLSVLGAMVWIGAGSGPLLQRFAVGFAVIAATLVIYAGWLTLARLGDWRTRSALLVLALNFGAFALAMWLLL